MRYTFLRICFTFLVMATSAATSSAQEIGIQLGSMKKMLPQGIEPMLSRVSELGIKEIEGGIPKGINRDQYKALLQKYNLKVVSTGGSFERLQNKDSLQKVIDNAKFLGAQ